MATALTKVQQLSLHYMYAGGQLKSSSIPVAEARAVVGVLQDIEDDDSPEGIFPSNYRCIYLLT
jgi:hypothetical protein